MAAAPVYSPPPWLPTGLTIPSVAAVFATVVTAAAGAEENLQLIEGEMPPHHSGGIRLGRPRPAGWWMRPPGKGIARRVAPGIKGRKGGMPLPGFFRRPPSDRVKGGEDDDDDHDSHDHDSEETEKAAETTKPAAKTTKAAEEGKKKKRKNVHQFMFVQDLAHAKMPPGKQPKQPGQETTTKKGGGQPEPGSEAATPKGQSPEPTQPGAPTGGPAASPAPTAASPAPTAASPAPTAASNAPTAASNAPTAASNAPTAAASNAPTAAASNAPTAAASNAPTAASNAPTTAP